MLLQPMARSRTRPSQPRANGLGGGVVLGIAYNFYSPAAGQCFVALGNGFGGVVGSLGVNIGMNFADQRAHVELGKDYDCVYIRESRQDFGAFTFWYQRTALALQ